MLLGRELTIRPSAFHYAAKHDVILLAVDWRGVPFGGFYPWSRHSRVGARHIAQSKLSLPRQKNAWKQIVAAKITGQANTLTALNRDGAQALTEISHLVRSGDPGNAEGNAARVYWSRLFSTKIGFYRDPQGQDQINSMLNYGYSIIRGFGIRAVMSAGLNPALGVFHRGRSNYFNLVDDLIEPFRPAIDCFVASLPIGRSVEDDSVRHGLVAAATQQFDAAGARIPTSLDELAQQFGRYVENEISRLKVTPWTGPRPSAPEILDD